MPQAQTTIEKSILRDMLRSGSGLVLLAGPPFSGKSTTARSLLEQLNSGYRYHIATLEDPVEQAFRNKKSRIEQYQYGRDVDSLAQAFRSFKQDDIDLLYLAAFRDDPNSLLGRVLDIAAGNCLVVWELEADDQSDMFDRLSGPGKERKGGSSHLYHLADAIQGVIFHDLKLRGRRPEPQSAHQFFPSRRIARGRIRQKDWEFCLV